MNTDNPQHTDPRRDPQHVVPTPADEALSVPRAHRDPAVEASTTPEAVRAAQVARTAVMTIGLILSVLALIVSAIVWGFGANSSNPHLASRGRSASSSPAVLR